MRTASALLFAFGLLYAAHGFAAPLTYSLKVNPNMKYEDGSAIPSTAVIQYRIYAGNCADLPAQGAPTVDVVTLAPGVSTFQRVSNDGDAQVCLYASQIVDGSESDIFKTPYTIPARPIVKKKPAPPAGVIRAP